MKNARRELSAEPALQDFLRHALSSADRNELVRRLVARCAQLTTERVLPASNVLLFTHMQSTLKREGDGSLGLPLDLLLSHQRRLSAEHAEAEALLADLMEHPLGHQAAVARGEERFQTWGFCEHLLQRCIDSGFCEPQMALQLAELGVAVAEKLNPETYGERRIQDLQALAWGTLGNARRINSLMRAAEEAFVFASNCLDKGTGDPLDRARFYRFLASLRGEQRRFDEANRLFDRSIAIFRRAGEYQHLGNALITKGLHAGYAGDPETAIRLLREGLGHVDAVEEPRLVVAGHHNLILYLNESGRHDEALALLAETKPLYLKLGDRMNLIRLRWLEGKILQGLESYEEAAEIYQEVRQEFASRGLGVDAALVSMDLASIFATTGRAEEVRDLAHEMLSIFQSRDLHREAIAALIVFQKAAEKEQVTVRLLEKIGSYLEQSRNNPQLRFHAP